MRQECHKTNLTFQCYWYRKKHLQMLFQQVQFPEISQILSCDSVVANEQYVIQQNLQNFSPG